MVFYTARQIEELFRQTGAVVLPYRARLTPMAADYVRQKKIAVGYSDGEAGVLAGVAVGAAKEAGAAAPAAGGIPYLYWCDGPCGAVKGAIVSVAKESPMLAIDIAAEGRNAAQAVRQVAGEVAAGRVAGAVLVVGAAAGATVLANRSAVLRAAVGTTIESLDRAMNEVAANVLVLEPARLTLMQARNLVLRFVKGRRSMCPILAAAMKEVAACA